MSTALVRLDSAVRHAVARTIRSLRDEKGEVNIVATVLLIVIAVALIVLFQEKLTSWITSMFDKIQTGVDSVG